MDKELEKKKEEERLKKLKAQGLMQTLTEDGTASAFGFDPDSFNESTFDSTSLTKRK